MFTHTNLGCLFAGVVGCFGAQGCRFLLGRRLEPGPAPLALLLHLLAEPFGQFLCETCNKFKFKVAVLTASCPAELYGDYTNDLITIFKVEAEPVESRVEITSIQHTALHRLLDVFFLKVELLQSRIQVLQAHQEKGNLNTAMQENLLIKIREKVFFTSNFLLVSLPDMGPLSPFSCLKSLISLMIFFSRSAWIATCIKMRHYGHGLFLSTTGSLIIHWNTSDSPYLLEAADSLWEWTCPRPHLCQPGQHWQDCRSLEL